MPRIRMCDADREKYGGDEWLVLEAADLIDEETGLIEQIEESFGLAPKEFLSGVARGTVKGIRALIWAARWKQGFRDNPRTFRPRTQEFSGVQVLLTERELELEAAREAAPLPNRAERRAVAKPARKSTAASRRSSTGTGSGSSGS